MFFPPSLAEDSSAPSEFLSPFIIRVSQSIDTLCADASMCYRSVQASTIYSYLFCSSPVLRYLIRSEYEKTLEKRECNIDHDNVFHSRSDSGATFDLAGISVGGSAI